MTELNYQEIVTNKTDKELLEVILEPHKYLSIIIDLTKAEIKTRGIDLKKLQEDIKSEEIKSRIIENANNSNLDNHSKLFIKPFSFEGRIRRLEYVLTYVIIIAYRFLFEFTGLEMNFLFLFFFLLLAPLSWLLLAQGAKRCHDLGNSGWCQLIPFYFFIMLFSNSKIGQNKYGTNPKNIDNFEF